MTQNNAEKHCQPYVANYNSKQKRTNVPVHVYSSKKKKHYTAITKRQTAADVPLCGTPLSHDIMLSQSLAHVARPHRGYVAANRALLHHQWNTNALYETHYPLNTFYISQFHAPLPLMYHQLLNPARDAPQTYNISIWQNVSSLNTFPSLILLSPVTPFPPPLSPPFQPLTGRLPVRLTSSRCDRLAVAVELDDGRRRAGRRRTLDRHDAARRRRQRGVGPSRERQDVGDTQRGRQRRQPDRRDLSHTLRTEGQLTEPYTADSGGQRVSWAIHCGQGRTEGQPTETYTADSGGQRVS